MMAEKNSWDIVVLGGANLDYLVRGRTLPKPGETVMGDEFSESPGGKGANQAVAARRLGASVMFVGRVGADERGNSIVRRLEEERVETKYIVKDPHQSTGVALIFVGEKGEKEILTAPGANRHIGFQQIQEATEAIRSARMLLTQLDVPLEVVMMAVDIAYQAGARVVLDPSPPISLPDELMHKVSLIKPNAREAQALTGIEVQDRDSARRAAKDLIERGVGAVAIQAGDQGNLIVTGEEEYWFPLVPVESIDATGAGDAFAAALTVALLEDRSWQEAGAWASAAAALKTTKLGAQAGLPKRDQVFALLEKEETDAKNRLQEKMDEALDESFPASDPPYWMPI